MVTDQNITIATEGSTLPGATNLYGTYQIRVEYYSDKSGADTPQTYHMAPKREIPSIQERSNRPRISGFKNPEAAHYQPLTIQTPATSKAAAQHGQTFGQ